MKGYGIYVKNDLLDPKHVKQMGDSVWLYMWFLDKMTSINENGVGKVLGNKPITFTEVEKELGLTERTYNRWISKLRAAGYINTLRTPHGLVIAVNKAQKAFKMSSAKNGVSKKSDPPKMSERSAKSADVNKDSNSINIELLQDNTITGEPVEYEKEISKIYYQAIKALGIPTRNHNNLRTKIKEMMAEDTPENLIQYLIIMRDKFKEAKFEHKPHVNEALDIHAKRIQIINNMKLHIKQNESRKVFRI
jgi:DNA-binding Lrp family transcriptional regulator